MSITDKLKDIFSKDYDRSFLFKLSEPTECIGQKKTYEGDKEVESLGETKNMLSKEEYKNGLEIREYEDGTKEYFNAHIFEDEDGEKIVDRGIVL